MSFGLNKNSDKRNKKTFSEKSCFIEENFKYKECMKFVPLNATDITESTPCYCGEIKSRHQGYLKEENNADITNTLWTEKNIILKSPTNAYGKIKFKTNNLVGNKFAEYVRVSDEDDLSKLKELMVDYWGLIEDRPPLLCISVIGGAKSFKLEGFMKDTFCKGLIRAAQTTNAWIMTSGLNLGIVSVVSDAIEEAQSYHFETQSTSTKIRCIGVAPWGYTLNRDLLIRNAYGSKATVNYVMSTEIKKSQPVSLNKNHTHYIFVDEGIRNSFIKSKAINVRADLEHMISKSQKVGGFGIPLVQVIVEGGYDTLIQISKSVELNIPVVVCSGTGRVADVLDKAIQFRGQSSKFQKFTTGQEKILKEMLSEFINVEDVSRVEEGFLTVTSIVKNSLSSISAFNLGLSDDFDKAILYALIKSSNDPIRQLNIALKFNRIDIVRDKLLNRNLNIDVGSQKQLMELALLENRPDFVELVIELGLPINEFVTMKMLYLLYNCSRRPETLIFCLKFYNLPTQIKLSNLVGVTKQALGQLTETLISGFRGIQDMDMQPQQEKFTSKVVFPYPYQELFLWAVLFNRHEMALIFWRMSEDALLVGMVGCNLYYRMAFCMPSYDTQSKLLLENQKTSLEGMLNRILEQCFTVSQERTTYLLERRSRNWSRYKCMELASQCSCFQFMSSVACQHAVNFEWRAGVDANPFMLILSFFFPAFILTPCFTFKLPQKEVLLEDLTDPFIRLAKRLPCRQCCEINETDENDHLDKSGNIKLPWDRKAFMFYKAPRTKFAVHSFFYCIFLLFFTYTILFGLRADKLSIFEAILMVYFCSFFLETVRGIVKSAGKKASTSFLLKRWIKLDKWHPYDIALSLISAISLLLRIGLSTTFIYAKTAYSIAFIFYFLRIFQVYSANQRLGPKLAMIFEMLNELISFILVLLVFLLSCGIAEEAILYPYRTEFMAEALKDSVYYSYYRLYGNSFTEVAEAQKDNCSTVGDGINCPIPNVIPPILLAFYLLVVAILLINLLIAIFSNVYQRVQGQSLEIWKFTKYSLLVEYKTKTILPLPFGVVQVVCEICAYILLRCTRRLVKVKVQRDPTSTENVDADETANQAEDENSFSSDEDVLSEDQEAEFMQRWALRNLITERQNEALQSLPGRIETLQQTMKEIHLVLSMQLKDSVEEETKSQTQRDVRPSIISLLQRPRSGLAAANDVNKRLDEINHTVTNSMIRIETILGSKFK